MADTQEVVEHAKRLGETLARHERVIAFFRVQEQVERDKPAQELLADYTAQARRMQQLEAEQKPIEVEDKRRMAELESSMAGHDLLKQLMRCQADYTELMNRVNQAITAPLATLITPKESE